MQKTL